MVIKIFNAYVTGNRNNRVLKLKLLKYRNIICTLFEVNDLFSRITI